MQRLTHTPYYDAWLAALRQALEPRGSKIDLARHMAAARRQPLATWKVNISRIHTEDGRIINAEDLLAISAWPPLAAILQSQSAIRNPQSAIRNPQSEIPHPSPPPARPAPTIRNKRTARNA